MPIPLLVVSWVLVLLVGFLSFRLARSGLHARSLPEGLLALFFLGGTIGYGVMLLRPTLGLSVDSLDVLLSISDVGFLFAPLAVALFTWLVFRQADTWARALAWTIVAGSLGVFVASHWIAIGIGREAALETAAGSAVYWLGISLRALAFCWASAEASMYYAKARRRAALGMVDGLLANRFLLWACWSGAATLMLVLRVVSPFVSDMRAEPPVHPTWLVVSQMVIGLISITSVWLTFAPPAFYRRRFETNPTP